MKIEGFLSEELAKTENLTQAYLQLFAMGDGKTQPNPWLRNTQWPQFLHEQTLKDLPLLIGNESPTKEKGVLTNPPSATT